MDKIKAAEEIGKFVRMVQAIATLQDDLIATGSLENAAAEAKAAIEQAKADLDAVKVETDRAKSELASKNKSIADTKSLAESIISEAKETSDRIEADAQKFVVEARADADKIIKDALVKAQATIDEASQVKADAEFIKSDAIAGLNSIGKEIADKQAELNNLNSKVEAVKASLAAFVK